MVDLYAKTFKMLTYTIRQSQVDRLVSKPNTRSLTAPTTINFVFYLSQYHRRPPTQAHTYQKQRLTYNVPSFPISSSTIKNKIKKETSNRNGGAQQLFSRTLLGSIRQMAMATRICRHRSTTQGAIGMGVEPHVNTRSMERVVAAWKFLNLFTVLKH